MLSCEYINGGRISMDVVIQGRTVKLLSNLFDRKTQNVSIVKTEPQKKSLHPSSVGSPLPRSSPEKQGISSECLCSFINELYIIPSYIL